MNTQDLTRSMKMAMVANVLSDAKVNELIKKQDFQDYLLSQKELIKDLLVEGFRLYSGEINSFEVSKNLSNEMSFDLSEQLIKTDTKPVMVKETSNNLENVLDSVTNICSEITGYPKEMLDPSLDLEADLGIDTVKQMEILSILKDKYNHRIEDGFALSDTPSINEVVKYLQRA